MSDFSERIKELRTALDITQSELGQIINKSENTIYNWEAGKSEPYKSFYKVIAEHTGADEKWLRTGAGAMFNTDPPNVISKIHHLPSLRTYEGRQDHLTVWGITGAGDTYEPGVDPIELLRFERFFEFKTKDCFRVKGDSMFDKLRDGGLIGVDFKDKRIVTGKLYVLSIPHEGLTVKELHVETGSVKIHAYNPRIKDYYLEHGEIDENLIVGRVVWWINEDEDKY